jgi:hypothetical protein
VGETGGNKIFGKTPTTEKNQEKPENARESRGNGVFF